MLRATAIVIKMAQGLLTFHYNEVSGSVFAMKPQQIFNFF